jgi:hypothetical protein
MGDRACCHAAHEQGKKRGFCPVLAANAAGYVHVPKVALEGFGFMLRVVRSAMEA